jgi:hypothetical protein
MQQYGFLKWIFQTVMNLVVGVLPHPFNKEKKSLPVNGFFNHTTHVFCSFKHDNDTATWLDQVGF